MAASESFVKAGKLRLVGVTSSKRFPGVENGRIIREVGIQPE